MAAGLPARRSDAGATARRTPSASRSSRSCGWPCWSCPRPWRRWRSSCSPPPSWLYRSIAERRGLTPWHPHHITERFGLFTLILLGESLLASTNAIIEALHDDAALGPLLSIAFLTLIVTAALWWIYFWPPHHNAITSLATSLRYGYVHYFVFAAAGAFSAGIEVEIDVLSHHSELSEVAASFTVTVPIAIFVLGIWWLAIRSVADRVVNVVVPAGAVLVLFDPIIPIPVTLTALIMIAVVVVLVLRPPVTAPAAVQ